jgi:IS30 family transposase
MGEKYAQLTLDERCTIARLREAGQSIRQIAAALDRSASTISRELSRNAGRTIGYRPAYAQAQAHSRRWTGSRLERNAALRREVLGRLGAGWSPEQVAGRLALDAGRCLISHESIYRFIHAQIRRTGERAWRHYLPRAKAKRGWRGRKGGSSALHIKGRVPIADRPADAADRASPGHWEGDTMLFAAYGQVLARRARARFAGDAGHPPAQQGRPRHRPTDRPMATPAARCHAPDHRLRQRHRIRPALHPTPAWHPDLLLRCQGTLAERRHRKRYRPPQAIPAQKDQSRQNPQWLHRSCRSGL